MQNINILYTMLDEMERRTILVSDDSLTILLDKVNIAIKVERDNHHIRPLFPKVFTCFDFDFLRVHVQRTGHPSYSLSA